MEKEAKTEMPSQREAIWDKSERQEGAAETLN